MPEFSREHEKIIEGMAEKVSEMHGMEVFDFQTRWSKAGLFIRVTIDCLDHDVSIGDCEGVSNHLSAMIDREITPNPEYAIEVSSPGVERPLRNIADFERFSGKLAKVTYTDNNGKCDTVIGTIISVENDSVILDMNMKGQIPINVKCMKKANLHLDYPKAKGRP